jgi:hypothetical protein
LRVGQCPEYVAGVYHDGDSDRHAHGLANVVTGAPMPEDTGFVFRSITKVLTATLVLQQMERGAIDLAEPVVKYLPEYRLTTPGVTEKIRVRHLLTHTNGIDAYLFFPDAQGRGALSVILDGIRQHCGTLFEPGEYISYSNGGMIVAGRLLEVVTSTSYPTSSGASCTPASGWLTHPSLPRKPSFAVRPLAISLVQTPVASDVPTVQTSGVVGVVGKHADRHHRRSSCVLEGVDPRPGSPERAHSCCPSRSGRWMMS